MKGWNCEFDIADLRVGDVAGALLEDKNKRDVGIRFDPYGPKPMPFALGGPYTPFLIHDHREFTGIFLEPKIDKVIFNGPATIVYWCDGEKTVVKCSDKDKFDAEKGIALCYMKKINGNKGRYNEILKKYCLPEEDDD